MVYRQRKYEEFLMQLYNSDEIQIQVHFFDYLHETLDDDLYFSAWLLKLFVARVALSYIDNTL